MKNKKLATFIIIIISLIYQSTFAQFIANDVDIVQTVKRSSVSIESTRSLDSVKSTSPTVIGSGVLILKNRKFYIVTNSHVDHALPAGNILLVGLNLTKGKIYNTAALVIDNPKKDITILTYSEDFYYWQSHSDTSNIDQACMVFQCSRIVHHFLKG